MSLSCPKCGSRYLRPAHYRSSRERIIALFFLSPLRCMDCRTRFVARTIIPEDFVFAHCPKCRRMDLNAWTGKTFTPKGWVSLKVQLGAFKWRCEYCRLNFASFRKRKEVFTFSRWKKRNPDQVVEKTEPSTGDNLRIDHAGRKETGE
jgi:hypothetical protein